jgi:hypothetical protein
VGHSETEVLNEIFIMFLPVAVLKCIDTTGGKCNWLLPFVGLDVITLALDGGEWLLSPSSHFTPKERFSITH